MSLRCSLSVFRNFLSCKVKPDWVNYKWLPAPFSGLYHRIESMNIHPEKSHQQCHSPPHPHPFQMFSHHKSGYSPSRKLEQTLQNVPLHSQNIHGNLTGPNIHSHHILLSFSNNEIHPHLLPLNPDFQPFPLFSTPPHGAKKESGRTSTCSS